jgi:hypothetical protein
MNMKSQIIDALKYNTTHAQYAPRLTPVAPIAEYKYVTEAHIKAIDMANSMLVYLNFSIVLLMLLMVGVVR